MGYNVDQPVKCQGLCPYLLGKGSDVTLTGWWCGEDCGWASGQSTTYLLYCLLITVCCESTVEQGRQAAPPSSPQIYVKGILLKQKKILQGRGGGWSQEELVLVKFLNKYLLC